VPECQANLAVVGELEVVVRYGRPQRVTADALQAIPLIGGHAEPGVEIEPVEARVALPEP
jgi:hypothetical protein